MFKKFNSETLGQDIRATYHGSKDTIKMYFTKECGGLEADGSKCWSLAVERLGVIYLQVQ
jgi:hypothetical protein